ncbi:MAG: hypothetical protein ACREPL_05970 [Rhodanobacteraceae bacterium]
MWALDCAYCEPNLAALAKLRRAHPRGVELVLVATDGPSQRAAVAARIKQMHMTDYPARLYAESTPERISYLIDSDWSGETRRTLVIRADGTRTAVSGELTIDQLRKLEPRSRPSPPRQLGVRLRLPDRGRALVLDWQRFAVHSV